MRQRRRWTVCGLILAEAAAVMAAAPVCALAFRSTRRHLHARAELVEQRADEFQTFFEARPELPLIRVVDLVREEAVLALEQLDHQLALPVGECELRCHDSLLSRHLRSPDHSFASHSTSGRTLASISPTASSRCSSIARYSRASVQNMASAGSRRSCSSSPRIRLWAAFEIDDVCANTVSSFQPCDAVPSAASQNPITYAS